MTEAPDPAKVVAARAGAALAAACRTLNVSADGLRLAMQDRRRGAVSFSLERDDGPPMPLLTLERLREELRKCWVAVDEVADALYAAATRQRRAWAAAASQRGHDDLTLEAGTSQGAVIEEALEEVRIHLEALLGFPPPLEFKVRPELPPRYLRLWSGDLLLSKATVPLPDETVSLTDPLVLRLTGSASVRERIAAIAVDQERGRYLAFLSRPPAPVGLGHTQMEEPAKNWLRRRLSRMLLAERSWFLSASRAAHLVLHGLRVNPWQTRRLLDVLGYVGLARCLELLVEQGVSLGAGPQVFGALLASLETGRDEPAAIVERARLHLGSGVLQGLGERREISVIKVTGVPETVDGEGSAERVDPADLAGAIGASSAEPPRLMTEQSCRPSLESLARRLHPGAIVIGEDELPPDTRVYIERTIHLSTSAPVNGDFP